MKYEHHRKGHIKYHITLFQLNKQHTPCYNFTLNTILRDPSSEKYNTNLGSTTSMNKLDSWSSGKHATEHSLC